MRKDVIGLMLPKWSELQTYYIDDRNLIKMTQLGRELQELVDLNLLNCVSGYNFHHKAILAAQGCEQINCELAQ